MQNESLLDRLLSILAKQTVFIVLVGLILFFSLTTPHFLSDRNVHNVARQISFDAIIAFGMVVVLIAGGIDLSVGSVLAMSAALTMGLQPHGVGVAVASALAMGVGVGAVNGWLVTRLRIIPFIATLGTMTLVYGWVLAYTSQDPIPGRVEWFTLFGDGDLGPFPIPFVIALVLLLTFHGLLTYTRFGRNLYAVGGNKEAALLAGVRVERYQFRSYIISGLCASFAGVLLASRLNSATIHIGLNTPLNVLAATIIGGASMLGGRGSAIGAFWGVLALGILDNGMNLRAVPTYYQIGLRALILITVVAVDAFYITSVSSKLSRSSAIGADKAGDAGLPLSKGKNV